MAVAVWYYARVTTHSSARATFVVKKTQRFARADKSREYTADSRWESRAEVIFADSRNEIFALNGASVIRQGTAALRASYMARVCVYTCVSSCMYNCVGVPRRVSTSPINKTMAESGIFWHGVRVFSHPLKTPPCLGLSMFAPRPHSYAITSYVLSLPRSDRSTLALSVSPTISHEMSRQRGLITSWTFPRVIVHVGRRVANAL